MPLYNDSVFHPDASNRSVRIFLVGLILGTATGLMIGGLSLERYLRYGKLNS